MDSRVEEFAHELELYSAEQAEIVQQVRSIFHWHAPAIEEKFIYGGIGFFLNNKQVGGVYSNKHHVSIVFSRGNELSDPEKLLEGNGKYRRHLKAFTLDDVTHKQVDFFVQQVTRMG